MKEITELQLGESDIQQAVLAWVQSQGYVTTSGAWIKVNGGSVSITVPITPESVGAVKK